MEILPFHLSVTIRTFIWDKKKEVGVIFDEEMVLRQIQRKSMLELRVPYFVESQTKYEYGNVLIGTN